MENEHMFYVKLFTKNNNLFAVTLPLSHRRYFFLPHFPFVFARMHWQKWFHKRDERSIGDMKTRSLVEMK